jgi:MFS family permease
LAASSAPALVAAAAAAARVPESPRFLCARGRGLEAAAVVRAVSRRTRSSRLHEGFRLRGTDAAGKSSEARRKRETSFFLFGENRRRLPATLKRVFPARFPAIAAIWFALSFGWYGTMLWLPEAFARDASSSFRDSDASGRVSQRVYLENLLVALAAAPGNVASAFSVDAVGRVKTLLIGACGACASALAFAAVAAVSRDARAKMTAGDEKDDWYAFVICACLFNALSVGGWNALDLLSAESFPTRARATALGILGAVGRVGAFAGTSAMGLVVGGSAGGGALWAPFLVAAAAMALAALAASGAAETAGTRLGALGEAGDDDDDDDDGFDDDNASSGDAGALLGRAASSSSAAGDAGWRVPERSVKVVLPVDA